MNKHRNEARAMSAEYCDELAADRERVARAKERPAPPPELAELFRTLGDHTRVHIASALAAEELCVCDLAELVGLSVSCVSHHLRLLRAMGLVRYRRSGRKVFYALDDEHVRAILREGLGHVLGCRGRGDRG